MNSLAELWQGMELVWLTLLGALAVVVAGLIQALRRFHPPTITQVRADEEGASYMLSYVIVIPFYLLFLCLVVEATFLLVAKVGTLYAAHAAARSAVVWQWAQPQDLRQDRISQAVFTAMAPFSPSARRYFDAPLPPGALRQATEWVSAYRMAAATAQAQAGPRRPYQRTQESPQQLMQHYLVASVRTTWKVDIDRTRPDGLVRCTVTYRAPLYIPGSARILDPDGRWPYEYPITSTATLPAEGPRTPLGTLGIDYMSR
jgi:hypothetical protein